MEIDTLISSIFSVQHGLRKVLKRIRKREKLRNPSIQFGTYSSITQKLQPFRD
jgi:hypothetical protein